MLKLRNLRVLFVLILAIGADAHAQEVTKIIAGNTTASIRNSDGLISFYSDLTTLSFQYKSFLSVKVGNDIYTNNDLLPPGTNALPQSSQTRIDDTVSSTWSLGSLVFTQRVFPQLTQNGLKIAVQFSAKNPDPQSVLVGCEYLLDISVDSRDATPVVYQDLYLVNESRKVVSDIPSYLVMPENGLPNPPTFDPGLVGMAIYKDDLNPLIQPSLMIVGHWPALERVPYFTSGFVVPPNKPDFDLSILTQWPEQTLAKDSAHVIGGFAFGAANYTSCSGLLSAVLFQPEQLDSNALTQDRILHLPLYVFNPNPEKEYEATLTVDVTGGLRLKDMDVYSNLRSYPGNTFKHVALPVIRDTTSELTANIGISLAPRMLSDQCSAMIDLLEAPYDKIDPSIISVTRQQQGNDCHLRIDTVVVRDNGSGLADISMSLTGYEARYLSAGIFPSALETIELRVIDTLNSARASVRANDRVGNHSFYIINYCATLDTLPPVITAVFNGTDRWDLTVTELRPWDRLLDHIDLKNKMNVSVEQTTDPHGAESNSLIVHVIDPTQPATLCLAAYDNSYNHVDTCLASAGVSYVVADSRTSLRLSPVPASSSITLIGNVGAHHARLLDVLGKTVWSGDVCNEAPIDVSLLEKGVYYLLVSDDSHPLTFPVMIVH